MVCLNYKRVNKKITTIRIVSLNTILIAISTCIYLHHYTKLYIYKNDDENKNLPSTMSLAVEVSSSPSCTVNSSLSSICVSLMISVCDVPSTNTSYLVTSKVKIRYDAFLMSDNVILKNCFQNVSVELVKCYKKNFI